MAIARVIWGVIVSPDPQVDGDGSWTYGLLVNLPNHEHPIMFDAVAPHNRTWDTDEWDIVSQAPGTSVMGLLDDHGQTQWFFNEERATISCDELQQANSLNRILSLLQAGVLGVPPSGGSGPVDGGG
jgi:hypothetical protein